MMLASRPLSVTGTQRAANVDARLRGYCFVLADSASWHLKVF